MSRANRANNANKKGKNKVTLKAESVDECRQQWCDVVSTLVSENPQHACDDGILITLGSGEKCGFVATAIAMSAQQMHTMMVKLPALLFSKMAVDGLLEQAESLPDEVLATVANALYQMQLDFSAGLSEIFADEDQYSDEMRERWSKALSQGARQFMTDKVEGISPDELDELLSSDREKSRDVFNQFASNHKSNQETK